MDCVLNLFVNKCLIVPIKLISKRPSTIYSKHSKIHFLHILKWRKYVIHSSWVSTKRAHLSMYECSLDDVAEFLTTKQMRKKYAEGNFSGGTGPSYRQINSRKDAKNVKASFTVIEEDSSPIHCNNENDGFNHQGVEYLNRKTKPRKLLKTFRHQIGMIALMKYI